MCLVVSGGLRGRSLHVMLKFEGPASLVKLLSHFLLSLILRGFRPKIRDTPVHEKMSIISVCIATSLLRSMETLLDPGRRIVQKGPSWRSGSSSAATLPTNRMLWISVCSTALTTLIAYVMIILQHPDHRDSPILFLHGPNATSFIQDDSVPFLNAWNCLFQMMKCCALCEDIVSSGTDQFTALVEMDPHDVLVHHMVDVQKATADF